MTVVLLQEGVSFGALLVPDCLVSVEPPPGSLSPSTPPVSSAAAPSTPAAGALDFSDPSNSGLIAPVS